MPRLTLPLPLAVTALLALAAPLAAQTEPEPAACPEGQITTPEGTCLATRGLGSKDSPPPTDSRTGDRGTRNLMGSAGSPDV
jgi:hypothetical protein